MENKEDKMTFIAGVDQKINVYVKDMLQKEMSTYRKRFGNITQSDADLWRACDIIFVVSTVATDEIDYEGGD